MTRQMIARWTLCAAVLIPVAATAQTHLTPHTFTLADGETPPAAAIEDAAFIVGHWRGDGFGGFNEEVWTPPVSGAMMGMYRLVIDGEVAVYELLLVQEAEGSLVYALKHFASDLTGWEGREAPEPSRLVAIEPGHALHFDGISFERVSDDEMKVWVALRQGGDLHEEGFTYRRTPPG